MQFIIILDNDDFSLSTSPITLGFGDNCNGHGHLMTIKVI